MENVWMFQLFTFVQLLKRDQLVPKSMEEPSHYNDYKINFIIINLVQKTKPTIGIQGRPSWKSLEMHVTGG